jgi:hypothetical protein
MLRNKLMVGTGILTLALMGLVIYILLFLTTSCVSPGAAKLEARVGVVEDNFNQLESVVDNNIEEVGTLKNQLVEVSNTVNNSGVIKYSGAGWVVVGTGLMAIIFLLAIGIFLKYYLKAKNSTNMLGLVTSAVKNIDPTSQRRIKDAIESQTSNGGPFTEKHKDLLAKFTKANGTFVEKVIKSIV